MYSFLVITVDETFPLYCMSKRSGLGVEEKAIGNQLSGTGFFYILIHFLLLTGLVDRYGFYKSMEIGALFSTSLAIPLSLVTNRGAAEGPWPGPPWPSSASFTPSPALARPSHFRL
mmetsp:Transcript_58222/g.123497  ORF Transcript_58222/g.123497 Transcript_58222/m.123497 type:complete len:116 (+) Transcript_58222:326-673(+)